MTIARDARELGMSHPFWHAEVLADSMGPHDIRLTSLWVRFPRPVLVELNTHGMLCRNASSRRAIPTATVVEKVSSFPYIPDFRKNRPGMEAGEPLDPASMSIAKELWLAASQSAIKTAKLLGDLGVQKSWPGWLLDAFSFVDVVMTATDWVNFFSQRFHSSAQPEMQKLASLMMTAMATSGPPKYLKWGEWHLPFIKDEDRKSLSLDEQKKVSVARCARVSYSNHMGMRDVADDIALYHRLLSARPMHMSPFTHQAQPVNWRDSDGSIAYVAQFCGWEQFRKSIPGESGQPARGIHGTA